MEREIPETGILQEWVAKLGLRHQGVLMVAIRDCDTAPKEDPSKRLVRVYRSFVLNTHCADPQSFIEFCSLDELTNRFAEFSSNCDHYPHHYVMHMIHAAEVIAYCYPEGNVREAWLIFYYSICNSLHMLPEDTISFNMRLNAGEDDFKNNNNRGM